MSEIGEFHLREHQLNRILAALLTVAALANAPPSPTNGTMTFYKDFLKQLNEGPVAKGFANSTES